MMPFFNCAASNPSNLQMSANDSDMEKYPHEALDLSSHVDTTLASCSEKLANLDSLLSRFLAETNNNNNNNIRANDFENDGMSAELIENTLTFDLLSAILNFELRELENLLGGLHELIVDALRKISSCENSTELVIGLVRRLHVSEELLKQSQDRVLEMEIQLAKLQMTSFSSEQQDWNHGLERTIKQRGSLRILEKSLTRELELEKKLKQLNQNEEDLKLKVCLVEQVASCMEEAAEVAWSQFLEADNATEVLMGISKDTLAKLHLSQLDLCRLIENKEQNNRKLQDFANQLRMKETLIEQLNGTISHLVVDNAEVKTLREKVQNLEKYLKITEKKLEQENASSKTSQKCLKEMEVEVEALREKLNATENRARSAEEKTTHLTDSNLELSEEVDFLKGSNDSSTKKVSILEKQIRELDIQFQHSRVLSESSQEQQNMLYTAIWDMETLIDELKQKVVKSESKAESAEERCIILSKTNLEVNKELEFMRPRVVFLEKSLREAALEKKLLVEDIGVRSGQIMETVMQLATERERVQKQLISCTKENNLLREKLQKELKKASVFVKDNSAHVEKQFHISGLDSDDYNMAKAIAVQATEISSEGLQVDILSKDSTPDNNEMGAFSSTNQGTNLVMELESERLGKNGTYRKTYMLMGILVVVLSSLAAHLFQRELIIF